MAPGLSAASVRRVRVIGPRYIELVADLRRPLERQLLAVPVEVDYHREGDEDDAELEEGDAVEPARDRLDGEEVHYHLDGYEQEEYRGQPLP